jgi:hypothetical protein
MSSPEVTRFESISKEKREVLLAEYEQVCKSHAAITDFRAKLLAILPIASGAGLGVLVLQGKLSTTGAALLISLGLFGAIVAVGLFLYERAQVEECKQLRNHGAWIESELGIDAGQFGGLRVDLNLQEVYGPRVRKTREREFTEVERAGRRLEKEELEKEEPSCGPVLGGRFVNAQAAGYVVYHAVIVAWLAVAGFGVVWLIQSPG